MAEDRIETRPFSWRQQLPWTELFRGFRVALGLSKLGLAIAGILTMYLLWYLLAVLFYYNEPQWGIGAYSPAEAARADSGDENDLWRSFRQAHDRWNLMYEAAGPGDSTFGPADLADSLTEYRQLRAVEEAKDKDTGPKDPRIIAALNRMAQEKRVLTDEVRQIAEENKQLGDTPAARELQLKSWILQRKIVKRGGLLRKGPWFEDRGPNPLLLVTGQAGVPWESGHFWDWLLTRQVPVLVEPLAKMLRPVVYFFNPNADRWSCLYFLLVVLVTLAVWSLFGGALTRMAALEVARNEKISAFEALRFVGKRYLSFLCAPLLPLGVITVLVVLLILFGVVRLIPGVGPVVVDGIFWWVALVLGLGMALFLVGLISWPLMTATVSVEDEESLNAFARAYSYLSSAPWHYIWYSIVALFYGAVLVFFVGFMASLSVYLARWGAGVPASVTGYTSRDPSALFIYAPTSFHWRSLLMQGAIDQRGQRVVLRDGSIDDNAYITYVDELDRVTQFTAVLVSIWLGLFFLLILGFGYSYFWTASTIIYLLMRRQVDDAELDEVYFEEDEQEDYGLPPAPAKPAAPPAPPGVSMVEPPALRIATPPANTAPAPTPSPAASVPAPPPVAPATVAPAVSTPPPAPPVPPVHPTERTEGATFPQRPTAPAAPPGPPAEKATGPEEGLLPMPPDDEPPL